MLWNVSKRAWFNAQFDAYMRFSRKSGVVPGGLVDTSMSVILCVSFRFIGCLVSACLLIVGRFCFFEWYHWMFCSFVSSWGNGVCLLLVVLCVNYVLVSVLESSAIVFLHTGVPVLYF